MYSTLLSLEQQKPAAHDFASSVQKVAEGRKVNSLDKFQLREANRKSCSPGQLGVSTFQRLSESLLQAQTPAGDRGSVQPAFLK
ncbi:hypothetical protein WJX79_008224 [Trebouxia sp. C0005]